MPQPSQMSNKELKALAVICNMYQRMTEEIDIQNGEYPYLMATLVDLQRKYGKEVLRRDIDTPAIED